jgi:hypothetical protein
MKYIPANFPENFALPEGRKQNKRQCTFDSQQPKNNLPPLESSSAGEDGPTGAWTAVVGYEGVDGNIRGYLTTSDFTNTNRCLGELEHCHVMPIFLWNGKTGFIAHCP